MKKDIIYIDVEDDITAVIGKVKGAEQKIVALVPPKRVGILQSAVNLRLLARAAEQNNKRLVLITSNSALIGLAAAAAIPVARNLQSKPELAEIPALALDDGEDIIDGSSLPVGELARTADTGPTPSLDLDPAVQAAVRENAAEITPLALPPRPGQLATKPRLKNGTGIPNFNSFRKKLALLITGLVVLIGFLAWAVFFAGSARIIITARTADMSANPKVTLGSDLVTDATKSTLKSTPQQLKKDLTTSFAATGTKAVGSSAKGQVVFNNCETLTAQSIPSGTTVTAGGLNYITQEAASVPGGTGGFNGCSVPGKSAPVNVVAADIGENYNTPSGTTFSVAGRPNNSSFLYFNAVASSDIAGGTKKQIKIVTAQDVQKAADQIISQNNDSTKKQLASQFNSATTIVLDQTFKVDRGATASVPAVDAEAPDGTAKLTVATSYTMQGVDKAEVGRFLDGVFAGLLSAKKDQRLYNNGVDKAAFTSVAPVQSNYSASLLATAQVGPKIDDTAIKRNAQGKNYGEIQASIESISGVDNVDVKFSPFWVNKAPNDAKRISVEFKLNAAK